MAEDDGVIVDAILGCLVGTLDDEVEETGEGIVLLGVLVVVVVVGVSVSASSGS